MSQSLVRLMAWLSPVFPTGGFAYSAGLEQAVADGLIGGEADLQTWLHACLTRGSLWNEAVLLAASFSGQSQAGEIALALSPNAQRHRETLDQGAAFLDAASAWGSHGLPRETPLPIALGAVCRLANIALSEALTAALQTQVSNQLQAAIRLSVIGQTGAARLLAALEPVILDTATKAEASTLDHLGGAAFMVDIMSTRHETLEPRIFLS